MNVLKRILKGIILKPETTDPTDASNGALWYDSALGKLRAYVAGSARSVVNEDQSQTLTNKTIDADSNTLSNIEDGDIKAAAAIQLTKLGAVASDRALQSDGSGFIDTSTVTSTELGYLSGVTSGVQSQLNGKASSSDLTTHMSDTTTHGTTGDIVGTSDTQNLSNKTFTSVTSFTDTTDSTTKDTGSIVTEGGLGVEKSVVIGQNLTVDGDLTVNGTTTTLNVATLDVEDANITINFNGNDAGAEGSGLTIDRTGTSGSFVYEDALASKFKLGAAGSEAQVVTVSHTQTLTNKTLTSPSITTPSTDVITLDGQASTPSNPSSGFYKAYVKDSTNKLTLLDSSGNETSIGAGGGSVNFVTNPDAEAGTTGYTVDSFAAASRPAGSLTGTTAGITFSTSSSSPLAGINSFTFAKDAANRQGRVVYTPITITPAFQAKVLQVSMDYIVSSGTFVAGSNTTDSDIIVYLQDVTNSTFIEPSSFKLLSNSSTISDRFNATFQTSATGTSYRLLIYVASTSASAYTLKLDNISISPSTFTSGFAGDDFTDVNAVSADFTGFGTPTDMEIESRRVGDSLEIKGKFVSGTATATEGRVALRYRGGTVTTAGTDKIASIKIVGKAVRSSVAAVDFVVLAAPNTSYVTFGIQDGSRGGSGSQNGDQLIASGATFTFFASVPILGWSSSVQTSDQTDTRVVAARYTTNAGQSISNTTNTIIDFEDKDFDSHGAATIGASWKYTAQVPGIYSASATITSTSTGNFSGTEYFELKLYKNGSFYSSKYVSNFTGSAVQIGCSHSDEINLVAGDYIDFRVYQTSGASLPLDTSAGYNFCSVKRLSGPSAIAASEKILVTASTAAQSISTATETVVNGTVNIDTHGAYNSTTGVFTAPAAGLYRIHGCIRFSSQTIGSGGVQEFYVQKNSDATIAIARTNWSSVTVTIMLNGEYTFRLVAGDTLKLKAYNNTTTALTGENNNFISVERIGN